MDDGLLALWPIFWTGWVSMVLCAMALAPLGVIVIARRQAFLAAAVAQAAAFGVTLALAWYGDAFTHSTGPQPYIASIFVAIIATVIAGSGGDGRTAGIFCFMSAATLLFVSGQPFGAAAVESLMTSSALTAGGADVGAFALLCVVALLVCLLQHRSLRLLALDPEHAAACGVRVPLWTLLLALWLGFAIGYAVMVTGTLYAFGILVLPTLVMRQLCRETWQLLVATPILAGLCALIAIPLEHSYDLPPAQVTIGILGALLPLGWLGGLLARRLRP